MQNTLHSILRSLLVLMLFHTGTARSDAMLGAAFNNAGWDTNYLDNVNKAVGNPLGLVNMYMNFDYDVSQLGTPFSNITARNGVPVLAWMPTTAARPNANLLGEISGGLWDAYIDNFIVNIKSWQASYPAGKNPMLLIRFAHEFDGNWYPWDNSPTQFIAAWRYIHQRFANAGVTGVFWVWCPNNTSSDDYHDIAVYYPGDDVVDAIATDAYNWGSNYSWSSWSTFSEIISSVYNKVVTTWPNKPFFIAEVASAEPSDLPNPALGQDGDNSDASESKSAWVQDMFTSIRTNFPAIKAVEWFNFNKELNFALDGPQNTGAAAFVNGAANPYFGGTLYNIRQTIDWLKNKILPECPVQALAMLTIGRTKYRSGKHFFARLSEAQVFK